MISTCRMVHNYVYPLMSIHDCMLGPMYPLLCRRRHNVWSCCPLWIGLSCHMRSAFSNGAFQATQIVVFTTCDAIVGVRDLPLQDMISLGAWMMGLGCFGKILPSPPSSPPSPTRIWKMATSRVSLRNQSFRSARIDPSRRAVAEGYMYV